MKITKKREPILSILTPAVPSRFRQIEYLHAKLAAQIGDAPVEHLIFVDNKCRTVGEKREALVQMALGKYIAFVDDDDDVYDSYISTILPGLRADPDVVTFRQTAFINDAEGEVDFSLAHKTNQDWVAGQVAKRPPWHVCIWRREIAQRGHFPASNYGEDWFWCAQVLGLARTEVHFDSLLHIYRHSAHTTEAPLGS